MAAKELKSCLLSKLSKKIFVFHHSRTVDPLISLPHTCIFQRESHNKWRPDEKKSKKRKSLLQNCWMLRAFDGGKGILGAVLNAWARFPMLSCLRASPTSVQVRGWKLFNFQHVTLVYCIPLCVTVPVWSQMIKEKCLLHISSERKKKDRLQSAEQSCVSARANIKVDFSDMTVVLSTWLLCWIKHFVIHNSGVSSWCLTKLFILLLFFICPLHSERINSTMYIS